ncbi:Abi family protein [Aeromonas dhakensis]|nr:Abi family protein [Aeromonas dhakensis]
MPYARPWLSYQQQLEQLIGRGITVTDRDAALSYLERIGYYRLSGYWYPFRCFEPAAEGESKRETRATDQFCPDTHLLDAVELYLFDKKLRLLVVDALERIEVALRVDLAYLLGKRNTFAHLDRSYFHPSFIRQPAFRGRHQTRFEAWMEKYRGLVKRSKEDFVRHYHQRHGEELPIWVAVEVFDFGAISQLIGMMKVSDQQHIASKYGLDWQVFASWIYGLSYLRNICAHHSRLWNRNVTTQVKLPKPREVQWCDFLAKDDERLAKPFVLLAITRHLLKVICPNTQWHLRLRDHLLTFPTQKSVRKLGLANMGYIENWQEWW